jgi:hypothetical protein
MNDNVEKQHSSFTLPKIIITNSSTKAKYSNNWCYKKVFDASLNHNLVIRLHNISCSKATTWLLCTVISKRDVPRSSLASSRKVEISTSNQNLNKWFFQNRNEPLIRVSDPRKCPQQESSTNTKDIWCMWCSSILNLGIWDILILGVQISKIKHIVTCEHYSLITSKQAI